MATLFKPTKRYIETLVAWTGGNMTSLPYGPAESQVSTTTEPNPLTPGVAGGFWGQFWYEVLRDMKYHRLQFHDEIKGDSITNFPENFEIKIPPTCSAKVNSAVDQVNIGDPQIKVHAPIGFRSADERASIERKLAMFCRGLIQGEERDSDTSPLRDQSMNTIAYGAGVRTISVDITRWPERPDRRKREKGDDFKKRMEEYNHRRRRISPFVTRSVHPLNIAYDRQNTPPKWAIIREPTTPWDAKAEYPAWDESSTIEDYMPNVAQRPCVRVWYITNEWVACYIDGKPALGPEDGADAEGVAKNPYGQINFWFSAGGSGEQDPYGRPEYELSGIIRKNRDVLKADASIFNMEEVYRQRVGLGPKVGVKGPDPIKAAAILAQILSNPLKGFTMEPGYTIEEVRPTELPPVVADQRARVNADIDRGMVYDVASGAGNPTEPAARTRVRLFQIDKRFATAVLHIQQTVEASCTAAIYMVRDVLKEPVGVNVASAGQPAEYVDLRPDEIPDGIVVEVNLIGDSEEEKARRLQMGISRLTSQPPTIDMKTFLEDYAQDADPEEIIIRMGMDAIRQNVIIPFTLKFFEGQVPAMVMQVMEEEGIQFSQQEMQASAMSMVPPEELAAMQAAGGPWGGGGGPQGGNIAVGPNGAVLPGEGDNAMVSRPNSPEGLAQTLRQGLPALDQGPRRAPPIAFGGNVIA